MASPAGNDPRKRQTRRKASWTASCASSRPRRTSHAARYARSCSPTSWATSASSCRSPTLTTTPLGIIWFAISRQNASSSPRKVRNLSSRIAGLRIVTADGSIVECSADENTDVFAAARVGLGALGVVSTVTLHCVPAFRLHAIEKAIPVDAVLEDFDGFMDSADHVEFYWVPGTKWALTKRNRRTAEPAQSRGRRRELIDDILISNAAFALMCRLGRRWPRAIPRLAKALPSSGNVEYTDRS